MAVCGQFESSRLFIVQRRSAKSRSAYTVHDYWRGLPRSSPWHPNPRASSTPERAPTILIREDGRPATGSRASATARSSENEPSETVWKSETSIESGLRGPLRRYLGASIGRFLAPTRLAPEAFGPFPNGFSTRSGEQGQAREGPGILTPGPPSRRSCSLPVLARRTLEGTRVGAVLTRTAGRGPWRRNKDVPSFLTEVREARRISLEAVGGRGRTGDHQRGHHRESGAQDDLLFVHVRFTPFPVLTVLRTPGLSGSPRSRGLYLCSPLVHRAQYPAEHGTRRPLDRGGVVFRALRPEGPLGSPREPGRR